MAGIFSSLFSCFSEKLEREEEVPFGEAAFGFEYYSKQTIETTLRYRRIYFKPSGSKNKLELIGFGSRELDAFPADEGILKGTPYTFIDTVTQTHGNPNTLYLDPQIFSKQDYETVVAFAKANYQLPINKNQLVKWMDTGVSGLTETDVYFTIYAIIDQKLSAFEQEYHAVAGEDFLRVRINNRIFLHQVNEGLQSESEYDYAIHGDTLFYPDYEGKEKAERLLTFKDGNGVAFRERIKNLVQRNNP